MTIRLFTLSVFGALLGTAGVSTRVDAAPLAPPRLETGSLVEPALRCRPGTRRHTITGKCVRSGSKYLWFS